MIYFKDEPISPSQLDASQLAHIQAFKQQLSPSGGFYWSFKTVVRQKKSWVDSGSGSLPSE